MCCLLLIFWLLVLNSTTEILRSLKEVTTLTTDCMFFVQQKVLKYTSMMEAQKRRRIFGNYLFRYCRKTVQD